MTKKDTRKTKHEGEKWHELNILDYVKDGKYNALCSCGMTCVVSMNDVKKGKVKSCGHILKQMMKERREKLTVLIGKTIGKITILSEAGSNNRGDLLVNCSCSCGTNFVKEAKEIKKGKIKSCGCGVLTGAKEANTIHGETGSKLYYTWSKMKSRCHPTKGHKDYGLRSISVCEEWAESYEKFRDWALGNGYQDCLSIDRIDVNGNYEPSNCRWATSKEQGRNKRNTQYVTINGATKSFSEWCEELGISYDSAWKRIHKYGYSPEKALTFKLERIKLIK